VFRVSLIALLAGFALALSSPALGETRYFGPAVLRPFEGAGSAYDNGCVSWWYNRMDRSVNSVGTVTFIDTGGGWHYTYTSGGNTTITGIPVEVSWLKKAYCYDSWGASYWANCWRDGTWTGRCFPS
jgi:hypothetical protein